MHLIVIVRNLFFGIIFKDFLFRQGKIGANSLSYLRKICSSIKEKDEEIKQKDKFLTVTLKSNPPNLLNLQLNSRRIKWRLNTLTAVTPVDGRYGNKVDNLWKYFSEYALIKYRVFTEIEYFIALCEIPLPQLTDIKKDKLDKLREIHLNFSVEDATRVKEIESVTNHDVKAVEYFIKEAFDKLDLG